MDIDVRFIGSKVREEKDFFVSRLNGHPRYVFIHFLSEVEMVIDNNNLILCPGTCIIYTPQCSQFYKSTGAWLNHDWIEFKCSNEDIFKDLMIPLNQPFTTTMAKSISTQIASMSELNKTSLFYKDIELTTKMYELLLSISKNIHNRYQSQKQNNIRNLEEIFEQIRLNIYQNPKKTSIKSLAKEAGYTQSYFCATYKKIFNTSPLEDLDKSRMLYVENAFNNKIKNTIIVDELGFSSLEYFYMWFKKHFHMTISEYQKTNNIN